MTIENLKCPECGGRMISRLNREKNQRFWGCEDYPQCRGSRDTDGLSKYDRDRDRRERHDRQTQMRMRVIAYEYGDGNDID